MIAPPFGPQYAADSSDAERDAHVGELRPAQRSHRVGRHVGAAERRRSWRQRPAARSARPPRARPPPRRHRRRRRRCCARAARAAPRRPSARSSPWPSYGAARPPVSATSSSSEPMPALSGWLSASRSSSSLSPEVEVLLERGGAAGHPAVAAAAERGRRRGRRRGPGRGRRLCRLCRLCRKVGRRRAPCAWRGGSWRGFAPARRGHGDGVGHGDTRDDLRRAAGWAAGRPGVRGVARAYSAPRGIATKFFFPGHRLGRSTASAPSSNASSPSAPRTATTTTTPTAPTPSRRPSTSTRTPRRAACRRPRRRRTSARRFQRERCFGL